MSKIAEFLTHFDDQHLANLQCAAEDGNLVYMSCQHCLLGHFRGEYSETKWQGDLAPLAREAEQEFFMLGRLDDGSGAPAFELGESDIKRRTLLLPLIQAEWARRQLAALERQDEMDHQINKMEELTLVSPSVR